MKLTMLGTGNAGVTECYNTCFLLEDAAKLLLVDGGGGNMILRQIKLAGYPLEQIHHIFVTHKHIDHLLGVIWIIRMICQGMGSGKYPDEAWIYSHKEVLELLRGMTQSLLTAKQSSFLDRRLHLVEVSDGETKAVIGHKVTFFDIRSTKAKQFGFRMELGGGKYLTCCGDEPLTSSVESYAAGCDWLLHEAFCLHAEAERFDPYEKHHSTVKDACELAQRLGVKNLLLYHTEDSNLARRRELYREEGQRYYHGKLWIPEDLESIVL